ncbi:MULTISPECIES: carboxylating nicotinate-nucleotide diphosphorylase [Brevibacterium]|uniref:Nicotinate-nucleotide pyrophosphorylase [carboxylating] n=2 Tax=Brevibacterium antiquum TaxID=234835 RepID=A0A2H1KSM1_9MICO|nr:MULTISPECIES: carboxylating nicotinate-nucleotide diphosphorylase [Brevibacterium]SMX89040.1 nicotinate-nucleotide pyrophosphorylase [carboxylating] [Brevibacterium antiquum]SMY02671.1 nicotinate-nucleotide pyrophosphorylase [carboxylating] [Brevibacterium antiquum CNRZ 918]HCG54912.1 carboxylating nicotinate-nucleotide diphosphorylase [Brevibacterium sp.]
MLTTATVESALRFALDEDAPWGDITGDTFVPASASAKAVLRAREAGVFAGGEVFARAFSLVDAGVEVDVSVADGAVFSPGDTLARVSGPARAVLRAERIALNFCQRMSGIATQTRAFVEAATSNSAGHSVRIVDTRKTTPGLRAFEKHAVRCGGGHNHRFGLSDAVMVKDNHLAVLAGEGAEVAEAIRAARARLPHTTTIEVEVDRLEQIAPVLDCGADIIMLDNFSLADLRAGVELIAGRAVVEASGNVTLDTVADIAATGVDVISSGALTHSMRAIDLGLDLDLSDSIDRGFEADAVPNIGAGSNIGVGSTTGAGSNTGVGSNIGAGSN